MFYEKIIFFHIGLINKQLQKNGGVFMIKILDKEREELDDGELIDYLNEEKDPLLMVGEVVVEIMDSEGLIRDTLPTSAVWYDAETDRLVITAHSDKMPSNHVFPNKR